MIFQGRADTLTGKAQGCHEGEGQRGPHHQSWGWCAAHSPPVGVGCVGSRQHVWVWVWSVYGGASEGVQATAGDAHMHTHTHTSMQRTARSHKHSVQGVSPVSGGCGCLIGKLEWMSATLYAKTPGV